MGCTLFLSTRTTVWYGFRTLAAITCTVLSVAGRNEYRCFYQEYSLRGVSRSTAVRFCHLLRPEEQHDVSGSASPGGRSGPPLRDPGFPTPSSISCESSHPVSQSSYGGLLNGVLIPQNLASVWVFDYEPDGSGDDFHLDGHPWRGKANEHYVLHVRSEPETNNVPINHQAHAFEMAMKMYEGVDLFWKGNENMPPMPPVTKKSVLHVGN